MKKEIYVWDPDDEIFRDLLPDYDVKDMTTVAILLSNLLNKVNAIIDYLEE